MRRLRFAAALTLLLLAFGTAFGDPFDDTAEILERWTSFHWGRDCFVWIVHYADELIDPWADAEALKSGLSQAQRDSYRETFVSELRMDSAEAFLVNIYAFGARVPNIAPVSESMTLINSNGKRFSPIRYDSRLDSPSAGLTQGLVFFPKQGNSKFAIAINGMSQSGERVFAFGAPMRTHDIAEQPEEPEVVIIDIPKPQPRKARIKTPAQQRGEVSTSAPKVVKADEHAPPPPPREPRFIPPLLVEDTREMEAFVESVRSRKAPAQESGAEPADDAPRRSAEDDENLYISRESTFRHFLSLWAENRPNDMYAMLSSASRQALSRENFAREIAGTADFRAGLKESQYRIDWLGDERAKVIIDRRVLMVRTLLTRTLGVVREDAAWKIVW